MQQQIDYRCGTCKTHAQIDRGCVLMYGGTLARVRCDCGGIMEPEVHPSAILSLASAQNPSQQ